MDCASTDTPRTAMSNMDLSPKDALRRDGKVDLANIADEQTMLSSSENSSTHGSSITRSGNGESLISVLETSPCPWPSVEMRKQHEVLFTMQTNFPLHGSWEYTEKYILGKDKQMCQYINEFPIVDWLIPQDEARAAYKAFLERDRLRGQGLSIFTDGVPKWWPLPLAKGYPMTTMLMPGEQSMRTLALPTKISNGKVAHSGALRARAMMPPPLTKGASKTQRKTNKTAVARGHEGKTEDSSSKDLPRPKISLRARPRDEVADGIAQVDPTTIENDQRSDYSYEGFTDANENDHNKLPACLPLPARPFVAVENADLAVTPRRKTSGGGVETFPWTKPHAADSPSAWDDSIYTRNTLRNMELVRSRNQSTVDRYDKEEAEKAKQQSHDRNSKKRASTAGLPSGSSFGGTSEDDPTLEHAEIKSYRRNTGGGAATYHSGRIAFLTAQDEAYARSLDCHNIDEAIEKAMKDPSNKKLAAIKVSYSAGNHNYLKLEIASFSLVDIVKTRLQLKQMKVLSTDAAHRIIDFCPHLLWGSLLLRIVTETTVGNKEMVRRLASNGALMTVTSIAHRIATALGKKISKLPGGDAWFKLNQDEYQRYKNYHRLLREKPDSRALPLPVGRLNTPPRESLSPSLASDPRSRRSSRASLARSIKVSKNADIKMSQAVLLHTAGQQIFWVPSAAQLMAAAKASLGGRTKRHVKFNVKTPTSADLISTARSILMQQAFFKTPVAGEIVSQAKATQVANAPPAQSTRAAVGMSKKRGGDDHISVEAPPTKRRRE